MGLIKRCNISYLSFTDQGMKRTSVATLGRCIVGLTSAFEVSFEGFQRLGAGVPCVAGAWAALY